MDKEDKTKSAKNEDLKSRLHNIMLALYFKYIIFYKDFPKIRLREKQSNLNAS